ncbi:hypothetical protein GWO43_01260 [candidate division KSB1 bacterium]|nr:hypothetical protein [candidate division KSB1 bacterium]NIS22699.1 hypothetical protein [candidate division KSB1 bacterium]NIT69547.1 hypothetical protein [candidate division KSB1 bacterium]NIU23201.1 hypothetical protein [candidate division KSB1 bacterium]NIU90363.1 hypothetical protein [candidate division KSB1 bacterium]
MADKLSHWKLLDSPAGKKILQELEAHLRPKFQTGNTLVAHESNAKREVLSYIRNRINEAKKESKNG